MGQSLTGVLVEMANLSTLIRARDLDGVSGKAAEIKKLIEDSISVVRNMALLLRPSMLDDLGLVPALEWQAREVSKRTGLWVQVDGRRRFPRSFRRSTRPASTAWCRKRCTTSRSTPRRAT